MGKIPTSAETHARQLAKMLENHAPDIIVIHLAADLVAELIVIYGDRLDDAIASSKKSLEAKGKGICTVCLKNRAIGDKSNNRHMCPECIQNADRALAIDEAMNAPLSKGRKPS